MEDLKKIIVPYLIWAGLFGEIALLANAYVAPLNGVTIPITVLVVGGLSAVWVIFIRTAFMSPQDNTRFAWENVIRLRYRMIAIPIVLSIGTYFSTDSITDHWCWMSVAASMAIQIILLFGVVVIGVALNLDKRERSFRRG